MDNTRQIGLSGQRFFAEHGKRERIADLQPRPTPRPQRAPLVHFGNDAGVTYQHTVRTINGREYTEFGPVVPEPRNVRVMGAVIVGFCVAVVIAIFMGWIQ